MAFLCPKFSAALLRQHYGGLVWAAFGLAAPVRGISTPCKPVAHAVESVAAVYPYRTGKTTMTTANNTPATLPYFVADKSGKYQTHAPLTEAQIIKAAAVLLNKEVSRGKALTSPDITRAYLQTSLRKLPHEVFVCLFLDNQHRVIKFEKLFRGTIDSASVYGISRPTLYKLIAA